MNKLEALDLYLKILASFIAVIFGIRKLYRWLRKHTKQNRR